MQFNKEQAKIIADFTIELYEHNLINKNGNFTNRAKEFHSKTDGSCYSNFGYRLFLNNQYDNDYNSVLEWAKNGYIWIKTGPKSYEWNWLNSFADTEEYIHVSFVDLINSNRKIYELPPVDIKSTMAKAAQLLDDEIDMEI